MGLFTTKLQVWNPANPAQIEEFEVRVDTGARYSWLSRQRLEALGIRPARRKQFRTIEGRMIERELAPVFVRADGQIGGDTVVLAEPGDTEVMGSFTLESLGLGVDPVEKRLVPTIGLALTAAAAPRGFRRSRIIKAIDRAIRVGWCANPSRTGIFVPRALASAEVRATHFFGSSVAGTQAGKRPTSSAFARTRFGEFET
jgi:predicted aspartyl protease